MPSRNIVKTYVPGGYYHIYNRGVEKRRIFEDEQDYRTFLKYLKEALVPPDSQTNSLKLIKSVDLQGETLQIYSRPVINFSSSIELIAYCLMPNHFHLLVKQVAEMDIKRFMQSIFTRYSMFFNKKYVRVGKLFQGPYKAVLIDSDNYLLHLSSYIHRNPSEFTDNLESAHSSYLEYIGKRRTTWIKPDIILSFFKTVSKDFKRGTNTYKGFVENSKVASSSILGDLALED